ncbi:MAG TPA: hypothetical protein VGL66_10015 [Caulobacteraceae bacterium]|jgi:hypothetical protein
MCVRVSLLAAVGLTAALGACAGETALSTDRVRDSRTAIRIGQAACKELEVGQTARNTIWYASLKGGSWDVWSSDGHEHQETLEVFVRASDGVAGKCDGVIVVP